MAENMDLKLRISAEDRTQGALGKINKDLGSVEGQAKALVASFGKLAAGLTAVGVSFAAISAKIGEALTVSADYEQRMLTLEGTLNATGYAAGLTADELRTMAQEIALSTLESTEGVERAAAQLLTFKSVGSDSFRTVLELGSDLSALGFGSLESNVVRLGKALEDPVLGMSALREAGVSFLPAQQEVIKSLVETGRSAEAQALILEAVAGQVEGAAQKAAQGLAGAWDTFGQRVEELNLIIGDSIAGIATAITDTGTSIVVWLTEQYEGALRTANAYRTLGEAVNEMGESARLQIRKILGLEAVMDAMGQSGVLTFENIAAAAAKVGPDGLVPLGNSLTVVNALVEKLADTFRTEAGSQREAINTVTKEIDKQRAALGKVSTEVNRLANDIRSQFDAAGNAIRDSTETYISLQREIYELEQGQRALNAEARGIDEGRAAQQQYAAAVRASKAAQEEANRSREAGDPEGYVRLLKEALSLQQEAANFAQQTGSDSTAINAAARANELSRELVGLLKEQSDEVVESREGWQQVQQEMQRIIEQTDEATQKMLGLGNVAGDIKVNVDLEQFSANLTELQGLLRNQSLIEVDLDKLQQAKEIIETAKFNPTTDWSAVYAEVEALAAEISQSREIVLDTKQVDQARSEIESLSSIETQSDHRVQPDTANAQAAIRDLQRNTSSTHTVYVRTVQTNATGGPVGLASGGFPRRRGYISGPGTETSDSIPSMLSRGEFVLRAAAVRKYGTRLLHALNQGLLPDIPRFATGGMVGSLANINTGADLPEMAVNLRIQGGQPMRLTTSRDTARSLANALRDLERGR
jgi:hypothetical protein